LKTDHVDLLQFHDVDEQIPIEESWGAAQQLISDGLVRYLHESHQSTPRSYQVGLARAATAEDFFEVLKKRSWDQGELVMLAVGSFAGQAALYPADTALTYRASGHVVRQIWPVLGPVDWPPTMALGDGGFNDLSVTTLNA
jgi:hypothetical protein